MSESATRTTVEVDIDSDLMADLQEREPDKAPAELVDAALEHYAMAYQPWIALDEAQRYGGGR